MNPGYSRTSGFVRTGAFRARRGFFAGSGWWLLRVSPIDISCVDRALATTEPADKIDLYRKRASPAAPRAMFPNKLNYLG
jgi:hypothetical protein